MNQSLQGINLLPTARREARVFRKCVRNWAIGCTAYAVAIAIFWGTVAHTQNNADSELAQEIQRTQQHVIDAKAHLDQLQPRVATARTTLAATRSVGTQPDWSLLLGLLADQLGEQMILTSCKLTPVFKPVSLVGTASDSDIPQAYQLDLSGLAQTQAAVSAYTLRIEQLKLFEKVMLIDTRTEPILDQEAVGFRVQCTLSAVAEETR